MNTIDELEELAIAILGLPEDSEFEYIEEVMYKRFGVSLEEFGKIASALMPFTVPVKGVLSGTVYKGFIKDDTFICKVAIPN